MSFAHPVIAVVALMVAIALATTLAALSAARRRALERVGHLPQLLRMTASLSPRRRAIKHTLVTTATALVGLALARPEIQRQTVLTRRGIDIAFAVDHSRSMLAADIAPSRLVRAKREVDAILDALFSDRVAMVAFAGAAAHFPLTSDHRAARVLFRGLKPQDLPPGSDLAAGIRAARCSLLSHLGRADGCAGRKRRPARSQGHRARAMVVFSDGERTQGDAIAEIAAAIESGIHVFIVGVGTTAGDLIPEPDGDFQKNADGSLAVTRLSRSGLEALAKEGAARVFFIDGRAEYRTAKVIEALASLQRGDAETIAERGGQTVFHWFLLPALALLFFEAWLSDRRPP